MLSELTHDLQGDGGSVFEAVHFDRHLIDARIFPLRRADEQDAVLVTVSDVDPLCVEGLTVLQPGHHRLGLSLVGGRGSVGGYFHPGKLIPGC